MSSNLNFIQYNEPMAGAGGGYSDTLNRALRTMLTKSGYNPDAATFPGLPGMVFNVVAFGADATGATDSTTAFRNAVAAASLLVASGAPGGVGGAEVVVPVGQFLLTDTVTIATHGIRIRGSGERASFILFNPLTPKVCFDFINSVTTTTLGQCGLVDVGAISTNAIKKTFARLTDVSRFDYERVSIYYSWTSTAFDSIGVEFRGRELFQAQDFSNYADRPFVFSQNPRDTTTFIDLDFFRFTRGLVHAAATQYCFYFDPTLRSVQHPIFEGLALVGGKGGFQWNGAGATRDSQGWVFKDIRSEQMSDTTGWFVDFSRDNFTIVGPSFINCAPSSGNGGVRLRRTMYAFFDQYKWSYVGGTKMFDFDGTNSDIKWTNLFTQSGGLYTFAGLYMRWQSGNSSGSGYALPPNAEYTNVASASFDVGQMTSLPINGPIGQNITPAANFGYYTNRTISAPGGGAGNAEAMRLIPALVAANNSDTLIGINISPTFTPGAFTGVINRGLSIANVAGGATNHAIHTGLGLIDFGDDVTTTGVYKKAGTQVVGARDTGWSAMTGSSDKATAFATGSVTLAQLAGRVMALQAALTAHGLIGT